MDDFEIKPDNVEFDKYLIEKRNNEAEEKISKKKKKKSAIVLGVAIGVIGVFFLYTRSKKQSLNSDLSFNSYDNEYQNNLATDNLTNKSINKLKTTSTFNVNAHLRKLPSGRKASDKSIANAKNAGLILKENQTYVKNYTKFNESSFDD